MAKIVKFVQDGCIPCVVLGNMLKDMEVEVDEVYITEENHEEIKEKYSIMGTPTMIAFDENEVEIARMSGINTGQVMMFLEELGM